MSGRILGVGVVLMVSIAGVWAAEEAASPAAKSQTSPFKEPIVVITLVSDREDLILLKEVQERQLADRRFLVGQGVDDEVVPDWRNQRVVWIAVNDIQQIVEFPSVEEFNKAVDLRKEETEARAASGKVTGTVTHLRK